jgi:dTDP-4-dehydrorhamnose 3,5-epimerase
MQIRPLAVPGCHEITPTQYADDRGLFLEWFRFDEFEQASGRVFSLRQANLSVSRKGVVRGIHYSDVPPGQAKYVTVVAGSIVDYAVDLRLGSPTFGTWDSITLDDAARRAVFLPEGIGHLFLATSETAVVSYLATDIYTPANDREINPLDPDLALDFPIPATELVLSQKDRDAPSLAQARARGILPRWDDASRIYELAARGLTR